MMQIRDRRNTVSFKSSFRARLIVAMFLFGICMAVSGGGIVLTVRAQTSVEQAVGDAKRDAQIESLSEKMAASTEAGAQTRARVEELERDVSAVRGAIWMGGAVLALLTGINIIITIRSGVISGQIEHRRRE